MIQQKLKKNILSKKYNNHYLKLKKINKRYNKVQANFNVNKIKNIEQDNYVWVEVEQIKWLVS